MRSRLVGVGTVLLIAGTMMMPDRRAESTERVVAVPDSGDEWPQATRARAILINPRGGRVGVAILTQEGEAVRIAVDIDGALHPGAKGFHIHSVGRCEPPGFESAGGHFDPTNRAHGFLNPNGPHAGDLPNLEAESSYGLVDASLTNAYVTLRPGPPNSILDQDGSSLIVHGLHDDYRSQPDGGADTRIACGVIEAI